MRVNDNYPVQKPSFGMALHIDRKSIQKLGTSVEQAVDMTTTVLEELAQKNEIYVSGLKSRQLSDNKIQIMAIPIGYPQKALDKISYLIKAISASDIRKVSANDGFLSKNIEKEAKEAAYNASIRWLAKDAEYLREIRKHLADTPTLKINGSLKKFKSESIKYIRDIMPQLEELAKDVNITMKFEPWFLHPDINSVKITVSPITKKPEGLVEKLKQPIRNLRTPRVQDQLYVDNFDSPYVGIIKTIKNLKNHLSETTQR